MTKPLTPREPASGDVSSVEGVLDMVRARGGRSTSSRRVLLEILFSADDHLTVEDLAASVQARVPDVHLSTIYRNVEELERLGVIAHAHLGHGPATYQLTTRIHAHFICEDCGAMVEAPDSLFEGLAEEAKKTLDFTIDHHHFAMFGRCGACAATPESGD